ncbi:AAA domain-containing protein [Nocardia sp. CA-290969]|uniref:AAA domain-containing protein n=1 Tax=Nocardia sp. CA-290969 TaxID=3239986 RepID=UPI003D93D329
MFVVGDRVVCGATDLERGARCEFALLRALDAELGTAAAVEIGNASGTTVFDEWTASPENDSRYPEFARQRAAARERYGARVVAPPPPGDPADPLGALGAAHTASVAAVRDGAPAILGAVFFDGDFFTHAELLTTTAQGLRLHGAAPGSAQVVATALRLAAAAAFLESLSVPVDPVLHIHAGTETHTAGLTDARPVYRAARRRMRWILDEHSTELLPVQWGDPRFRACGRCDVCTAAYTEARDLLLVAGMDPATRSGLRAAGIHTIDRLTTGTATPPGVPGRILARLRAQAVVQLRREHSGRGEWIPADPAALDMLPPATRGDLALHVHRVAPDRLRVVVASRETTRLTCELPLEHDRLTPQRRTAVGKEARRAFADLLAALTEPLLADPELHIYHYTADARTLLLHTAGRLGSGEETVDALLRTGTLVDLYPIVRGAFVLGTRSYALDEVAPVLGHPGETDGRTVLWLADRLRKENTAPHRSVPTGALDRLLRDTPPVRSSSIEAALAEYAGRTESPAEPDGARASATPADPHRIAALTAALLGYHRREQQTSWWAHVDRLTHPLPEWPPGQGVMVADSCAVDTQWHIGPGDTVRRFLRLRGRLTGTGLAPGTRVYVVYEPARRAHRAIRTVDPATVLGCSMDDDLTDTVRVEETLAPGAAAHDELPVALAPALPSAPDTAADALEEIGEHLLMTLPAIPENPVFDLLARRPPRLRPAGPGAGPEPPAESAAAALPTAGTAGAPQPTRPPGPRQTVSGAFEFQAVHSNPPAPPPSIRSDEPTATTTAPATGRPVPRTSSTPEFDSRSPASAPQRPAEAREAPTPPETEPTAPPAPDPRGSGDPGAEILAVLRELDHSYLAVQGPTGTGRTAILAEVLATLVTRDNWRIGIVAPGAAPVENLLDAIVRAGVLPELVAKSDAAAVAPEWLVLDRARYARFLSNAIRGCVLGGTPDDFTDPARVPRGALDLLVIADANAFPLAAAAAVSVSARNLLLTGDPTDRHDRAPGPHPEPVDIPALTWLTGDRRTLPADHGFFLGSTRRIHPQVSDPVSRLYFGDRLRAAPVPPHPEATLEPGISTVLVEHHGNTTSAAAEAREVLQQIRDLLGRSWFDGSAVRQLQPHDIVVVSPFRAQVSRIRTLLSRARIDEVLVGTPELFRGREAAVVLVSPATSSPEDATGPVGALLSPTLVHDALCRARRRAIIIRSPLLTEYLPDTLGELSALASFIQL